jgi:hypothetical protein
MKRIEHAQKNKIGNYYMSELQKALWIDQLVNLNNILPLTRSASILHALHLLLLGPSILHLRSILLLLLSLLLSALTLLLLSLLLSLRVLLLASSLHALLCGWLLLLRVRLLSIWLRLLLLLLRLRSGRSWDFEGWGSYVAAFHCAA